MLSGAFRPVKSRMKSALTVLAVTRPFPARSHSMSVARRCGSIAGSRSTATISIDSSGCSANTRLTKAAVSTPEPAPGSSTQNVPYAGRRGKEAINRAAGMGVKNCPKSLCVCVSSPSRAARRSTSAMFRRSVANTLSSYRAPPTPHRSHSRPAGSCIAVVVSFVGSMPDWSQVHDAAAGTSSRVSWSGRRGPPSPV